MAEVKREMGWRTRLEVTNRRLVSMSGSEVGRVGNQEAQAKVRLQ
jgi:hypothetical protein